MSKEIYEIGQEVFYIDNWNVKKSIIESIQQTKKGTTYDLKDYWGKSDIYGTQKQAEKQLNIEFSKLKFHIGDIVLGKNQNRKIILGKIIEIILDNDENEHIYLLSNIDRYGWCSSDRFKAKELTKVKEDFIKNYSDVGIYREEIHKLEYQARQYQQKINKIYLELDEELKTSYRKYYSYFNWNKQEYKDRFVIK